MSEPLTDAELAAFDAFAPALVLGDKLRAVRAECERGLQLLRRYRYGPGCGSELVELDDILESIARPDKS